MMPLNPWKLRLNLNMLVFKRGKAPVAVVQGTIHFFGPACWFWVCKGPCMRLEACMPKGWRPWLHIARHPKTALTTALSSGCQKWQRKTSKRTKRHARTHYSTWINYHYQTISNLHVACVIFCDNCNTYPKKKHTKDIREASIKHRFDFNSYHVFVWSFKWPGHATNPPMRDITLTSDRTWNMKLDHLLTPKWEQIYNQHGKNPLPRYTLTDKNPTSRRPKSQKAYRYNPLRHRSRNIRRWRPNYWRRSLWNFVADCKPETPPSTRTKQSQMVVVMVVVEPIWKKMMDSNFNAQMSCLLSRWLCWCSKMSVSHMSSHEPLQHGKAAATTTTTTTTRILGMAVGTMQKEREVHVINIYCNTKIHMYMTLEPWNRINCAVDFLPGPSCPMPFWFFSITTRVIMGHNWLKKYNWAHWLNVRKSC